MMILSIVKIAPLPEKRKELLDILRTVKGPTQAVNACLACHISEEEGDDGVIIYQEQWQSWEDFMRHIRSDIYAKMLEALELSRQMPDVCFYEVSAIKGMELLNAVRKMNRV
jgi:quinol monooxygenase YgiN